MRYILLTILLFPLFLVQAKVVLPPVMSDNMVLQQNSMVQLWGKATPGSTITITPSWNKTPYSVLVDSNGNWKVKIGTTLAGGPYTISFFDGELHTLSNVLLGEVWICSGQSNMQMTLGSSTVDTVTNAKQIIAESDTYPDIRMFTGTKKAPFSDPTSAFSGSWSVNSSANSPKFSAVGYTFALELHKTLQVPVGMINVSWGGSTIQTWMSQEALKLFPEVDLTVIDMTSLTPHKLPTLLYENMFLPVADYTVDGILWYQGENNVDEPALYKRLLPAMAKDWRTRLGLGDIPFLYVQIAPYKYDGTIKTKSAYLREAQLQALSEIPNAGMVVTMDVGSEITVHPPQKQTVGRRLANIAYANQYGYCNVPNASPVYIRKEISGNKIILTFDYVAKGLLAPDPGNIAGFKIADSGLNFIDAQAKIVDINKVEVWSDAISSPVHVRYCFQNYIEGTLKNSELLPASSFRTDF